MPPRFSPLLAFPAVLAGPLPSESMPAPLKTGRVERLVGTLKEKLDQLAVDSLDALNDALGPFRIFYNHITQGGSSRSRRQCQAAAATARQSSGVSAAPARGRMSASSFAMWLP